MRILLVAAFAAILLMACDDNLQVISRDFSVTLKSVEGNTAIAGKAVKCIFTVSGLDEDNEDQLFTTFSVTDDDGLVMVENNEYEPGEAFEFDYKKNGGRMAFDFIPKAAGAQKLVVSLASDIILRSDSVTLKVKPQTAK